MISSISLKKSNKSGTTEEALANAEKLGFDTTLFVEHPFIKNKKFLFISQTLF